MRKGALVRLTDTTGKSFRPLTERETLEWREDFINAVKTGLMTPYDDAGETVLPPRTTYVITRPDRYYVVLRARCSAMRSYRKVTGLCEVCDPETTETFYVPRACVRTVEES